MNKIVSLIFISLFLQSCATTDNTASNTVEGPIAIELKGTAVEVQNFIEEMIPETYGKKASGLQLISADNRSITFQTDCMNVEGMGAFKCTGVMMVIGNTGWDGPYLTITYRTNEIRGVTKVRSEFKFCATNILGKISCGLENVSVANDNLRELKSKFDNQ